jgi:hypothetical protein
MEFRLLYQGQLLGSDKEKTRAPHKHMIRRSFHPQLRRLWKTKYGLTNMAEQIGFQHLNDLIQVTGKPADIAEGEQRSNQLREAAFSHLANEWGRAGYGFIPLVTPDLALSCSIDMLMLRPEETRLVMNAGDLDARVKTVFDALRIPDNLAEAGGHGPQDDETPFFCLLSDDKMVSEIRVRADELLALPGDREPKPNDVYLQIHVRIKPRERSRFSWVFDPL